MSNLIAQHPILIVSLVKIAVLMFIALTTLAYLTWFERKVVAHIQSRWGPYRTGPHGLLQPLADGLKFLFKEDPAPAGADRFVYFLAPFLALSLALTSLAVIPFGPKEIVILGHKTPLAIADLNIGLLVLFAITSLGVYGVALAGWSSNSKYPLLGGLRSSAQMVSYELTLTMSVVGVLLLAGSFNLREIIESQAGAHWWIFPRWNIFAGSFPQVIGFFCFFTAAIAETNRLPFDLAEAESELVAGFHTEYASFKFAMFFMAEYASMITVSCLATILFFGGWLSPFGQSNAWGWTHFLPTVLFGLAGLYLIWDGIRYETVFGKVVLPFLGIVLFALAVLFTFPGVNDFVQGPFWFLLKVLTFLFIYVWLRGTLPRFRYDQLMAVGWKLLLPLSIANVVLTSLAIVRFSR
ncbi:MAG TPA: complex I subunit 1 family protein [Candidatus Dormibacteraeota bacterium]|nr:complex I subunit 1 family protein [Candidatus Dormibacteraeota bacterium]